MSQSSATNSDATKRILAKAEAAKSTQIQTVEELSRQGGTQRCSEIVWTLAKESRDSDWGMQSK
jgi:hypothetical protein